MLISVCVAPSRRWCILRSSSLASYIHCVSWRVQRKRKKGNVPLPCPARFPGERPEIRVFAPLSNVRDHVVRFFSSLHCIPILSSRLRFTHRSRQCMLAASIHTAYTPVLDIRSRKHVFQSSSARYRRRIPIITANYISSFHSFT